MFKNVFIIMIKGFYYNISEETLRSLCDSTIKALVHYVMLCYVMLWNIHFHQMVLVTTCKRSSCTTHYTRLFTLISIDKSNKKRRTSECKYNIYIYFRKICQSVCLLVCYSVTASLAQTVMPVKILGPTYEPATFFLHNPIKTATHSLTALSVLFYVTIHEYVMFFIARFT